MLGMAEFQANVNFTGISSKLHVVDETQGSAAE
jgi:hypothetical protein